MRVIDSATQAAWESGAYIGDQRAQFRVTVQAIEGRESAFQTQVYFAVRWGQMARPIEIPNIRSVDYDKHVGTPVSQATVTLWNARPLPIGQVPEWDLDERGYYTPLRGGTDFSSRWGDLPNPWTKVLQEDRLIRIYGGFGFDDTVAPELDPHMYLLFTGLITDVAPTANGLISLVCDDLGRELNDCIAAPPVVPFKRYPKQLRFEQRKTSAKTVKATSDETGWFHPKYETDSGKPYNGFNGEIYGHRPSYAFDGDASSYWLSIGNDQPGADYAFEYVQGHVGKTISSVKAKVWGGPYKVYCSIKVGGVWQGNHTIPYNASDPISAPNGANIRFIMDGTVDREDTVEFHLAKPQNVESVRLTFTDLTNSKLGSFPYRAGVRDFLVNSAVTTTKSVSKTTGNFDDYTDIVKLLLAYGGFHWPRNKLATDIYSDASRHALIPAADDPVLQKFVNDTYTGATGRVWGDFGQAGTPGIAPIDITNFDKKPLIDGITYVADILNFLFTIDENGAAIWRPPNIWSVGNYLADPTLRATGAVPARTTAVHTFDEKVIITDLTVTRSAKNKRERVMVASTDGRYGAVVNPTKFPGYGVNAKLRRTAIWTDTHWNRNQDCQIAADLIAVRQLWSRRTDRLAIVGTPAVQIDDQAQIFEHTTNEGYLHYILGISSSWSATDGKWKMTLDTNWLGETPFGNWMFNPADLSSDTQAYLHSIGVT